jgi:hypothetical protein
MKLLATIAAFAFFTVGCDVAPEIPYPHVSARPAAGSPDAGPPDAGPVLTGAAAIARVYRARGTDVWTEPDVAGDEAFFTTLRIDTLFAFTLVDDAHVRWQSDWLWFPVDLIVTPGSGVSGSISDFTFTSPLMSTNGQSAKDVMFVSPNARQNNVFHLFTATWTTPDEITLKYYFETVNVIGYAAWGYPQYHQVTLTLTPLP